LACRDEPDGSIAILNVALLAAKLAIFSVEHTADVDDGTVYKSVLDVIAGFDCPNIL